MRDTFTAPRWLASTHMQTLGATLPLWAPPRSFLPERDEMLRIPLPAGGALHARAWWQPDASGLRGAVVVVHGIGGSIQSRYVVRAAVALHRAGWHVVRLNLRGAGDSIADAPQLYHAGLTEDLRVAIEHVAACDQVDGLALVGFSLGGHVVLRLAGEIGQADAGALRALVAISAPVDLAQVTRAIERLRSLPYHMYVLRRLVRQGIEFAQMHPKRAGYDAASLRRVRSIRAYDRQVIAPMHGFASAEDYYTRASAGPLVDRIRVPTLFVHAEDDPMVPPHTVRDWLEAAPPALEQAWTNRGGHVGWFAGLSESSWVNTWALNQTRAFLARFLGIQQPTGLVSPVAAEAAGQPSVPSIDHGLRTIRSA
ncbi:MAG: alpha/beta fold hydrolase, partial [Myxococcota bacterium]|nr:alpha/beta fold hydrolase [Myxococcota bacterium]